MIFRMFYHEALAQASYLIGCPASGEALVIDPNRDIDHYIDLAHAHHLHISAVTETHIHADFVSGSRELAHRTGARLLLSDAGPAEWKYAYAKEAGATLLHDGDTFRVGNIQLRVLHTPGHTPEHLSFLLTDTTVADAPMGLFTGDVLFVGDVGRPDLLERAAGMTGTMEEGARLLFRSLHKLASLPDYLQIWPGHGAGSACGRALGAVPQSTLGYERRFNWGFALHEEERFVQEVLAGQPEPPTYFAQMKRLNKVGPRLLDDPVPPPQHTVEQLTTLLDEGALVVDTRPAEEYASGAIPGTINIPFNGSFLTWAGWLLPYDRPLVLLADELQILQIGRLLRLIGLDQIAGYLPTTAVQQWETAGTPLQQLQHIDVSELKHRIEQGGGQVLDVRNANEYAESHIQGAVHIPLGTLGSRLGELPPDQPIAVHCQGGARSAIAASLLAAHGYIQVIDVIGGMNAWKQAGNAVEQGKREAHVQG